MMYSGSLSLFIRAFLLLSISQCCYGKYYYDLFGINGMSPSIIKRRGMIPVQIPDKGYGVSFDKDVDDIRLNTTDYAYLANTLQTSDDVTFSVYFKITSIDKVKNTYFPFFALSGTKLLNNYFAIGLESKRPYVTVEGDTQYGNMTWYLVIESWQQITRNEERTEFHLGELGKHIKLGEWLVLMVRILRKGEVTITINCKKVKTNHNILKQKIESFSTEGYFTLSQFLLNNKRKQFVGSLYKPEIFSGELAYNYYSPCLPHKKSEIKPEPRPIDYNPKTFNEFQKMNNQKQPALLLYCIKNGIKHRSNGDPWKIGSCFKYKCVDGKLIEFYTCRKCRDGKEQHKDGQKWISKEDKCIQKSCLKGRKIKKEAVVCKRLTCPVNEQYTPKGKCCKRCKGDDCTKRRVYYTGCERKCDYGVGYMCPRKEAGCYCAPGKAMNHMNTKCIPTALCKCRVSTNLYLPGQAIKRSLCEKCICSHGKLVCFKTC